jgi:GT2 family glycosyltransferase
MELTIAIVSYNTRQLLLDCLESIYRTAGNLLLECIVVDNASSDGSAEAIQKHFPQVRLIANTKNHYFSAANNQAIQAATGRYILLLNPDTIVCGRTLQQLVQYMDNTPEVGAATTTMRFPDETLQRNGCRFTPFVYLLFHYTWLGRIWPQRRRVYEDWLWYADWDRTTTRQVDVLPGCCIIASQAVWDAVDGLNASMRMYFSDDFLSRAVQRLGRSTMFVASDGIIHYENASTRHVSRRALSLYMHDLLVYARLTYGLPAWLVLAVLLAPTWLVQLIRART